MKPPPPMLPAEGCTTASANAVATAASMAVPPSSSTRAPTCDANWFCETTIPPRAREGTELAPTVAPVAIATQMIDARHFITIPARLARLAGPVLYRPALPAQPALFAPSRLHFDFE